MSPPLVVSEGHNSTGRFDDILKKVTIATGYNIACCSSIFEMGFF
jgi:hypothetical protein